ncbi:MAG: phosphoenolpyruvate--protein phosphotransferase, partial [Halobacteriovoraceae bacterium]|nr:phosphoenolpyruvate--protein phosphotransferase [Halobacteriovoraceae bacterium]
MQKINYELIAPLTGVLLSLSDVPDPVFSEKMVGDGYAIDPMSNQLLSPVKGKVIQIPQTCHAITIESDSGEQILMHIGIDTVNLQGKGFEACVKEGDIVNVGSVLLEFDLDYLALHAKSLITPVLILNNEGISIQSEFELGEIISPADKLFSYSSERTTSLKKDLDQYDEVMGEFIVMQNKTGLHARPSAKIVTLAKQYNSEVYLVKNNKKANAKSLVALIGSEILYGDKVQISAIGSDAQLAVETLSALIKNDICEAEHSAPKVEGSLKKEVRNIENVFSGTCASNGLAVGKVFQLDKKNIEVKYIDSEPECEKNLFFDALNLAKKDIAKLEMQFANQNTLNSDKAKIFSAHIEILDDPTLVESTLEKITKGANAAFAWSEAFNKVVTSFKNLDNDLLAGRANDIEDVGRRVLKILIKDESLDVNFATIPENSILIAENLTPSETAKLDKNKIKAFATIRGGSTSHVAILARSLDIPAIVGIHADILSLSTGTDVIVDASCGEIKINYTEQEYHAAIAQIIAENEKKILYAKNAHKPACTTDGIQIEVAANIANLNDAKNAQSMGCDGVGLLRSEFLFTGKKQAPSITEQTKAYQDIADALKTEKKNPLVIRTLDVGGDKPLAYLPIDEEENPFLGERGIRVSLNNKDIFRDQLKSILAIKPLTNIHIMFPMVSDLNELLEAKQIISELEQKLGLEKVSVGIMVEVPATALMAEIFAKHVDFFSIGANDLTQYVTAIDRGHVKLANMADGLNPGVL